MNDHERTILQVLTFKGIKVKDNKQLWSEWIKLVKKNSDHANDLYKEFSK